MVEIYKSGDSLHLQNLDHHGIILVTSPLTSKNFNSWSRSIIIALGAKLKLVFYKRKLSET